MKILVCGTPGVGKTTLSIFLSSFSFHYFNLNTVAFYSNSFLSYDKERDSYIVNTSKLLKISEKLFEIFDKIILDSHIVESVPIDIDLVLLLRSDPLLLYKRLYRKYGKKKIIENVEAEFLGIVANDCYNRFNSKKIFEIVTNNLNLAKRIAKEILYSRKKRKWKKIDWLEIYEKRRKIEVYHSMISKSE
ncbi:MAG: AAA family ATPase [Thermoproteota archaeon]|nr:AAA family ATPase [Thermoproteota archaeon]